MARSSSRKNSDMLRNALLVVALAVAVTGIFLCLVLGQNEAWPVATWGSVLFVLIVLERWRYQKREQGPLDDWQATDEQFIDPETGKLTRVFYKPGSGERRYVKVDDDGSLS